jgi:uncharacterized RDD family membrane protein YckC
MADSSSIGTERPEFAAPPASLPPPHPLDEMWYVQGETTALGPYCGDAIVDMIGQGSVSRSTHVAKVGSTAWSVLGDVPAFKGFLAARGVCVESFPPKGVTKPTYAGFWIRLGAYVLDYVILTVVLLLAIAVAGGVFFVFVGSLHAAAQRIETFKVLVEFAGYVFGFFYYVYFMRSPWQATPGKRVCGIYVTRADGSRINGWLALGRTFAYMLSLIPLGIGFFMIGWTDQKKALHDMVCRTRVVRGRL